MKSKYPLPWDVKQECLWIVRGYDRRRKVYREARRDILEAGGENYATTKNKAGQEVRVYGTRSSGGESRPVEIKQAKLDALEESQETKRMRAVEQALALCGADLPAAMRRKLQKALLLNCQSGRRHPYESLGLDGISRSDFFRRKDLFLAAVARHMGLI